MMQTENEVELVSSYYVCFVLIFYRKLMNHLRQHEFWLHHRRLGGVTSHTQSSLVPVDRKVTIYM